MPDGGFIGWVLLWCGRVIGRVAGGFFGILLGSPLPGAGSLESEAVLRGWPIGLAWSILMFVVGGAQSGCGMPIGDIFCGSPFAIGSDHKLVPFDC